MVDVGARDCARHNRLRDSLRAGWRQLHCVGRLRHRNALQHAVLAEGVRYLAARAGRRTVCALDRTKVFGDNGHAHQWLV